VTADEPLSICCPDCGAQLADRQIHADWHHNLTRVLELLGVQIDDLESRVDRIEAGR
jgi:hypothetical protein